MYLDRLVKRNDIMNLRKITADKYEDIKKLSSLATSIVREHYDPILGKAQNDYMIEKFQSEKGIIEQINNDCQYYVAFDELGDVGFMAFYKRDDYIYLSKLYLKKEKRGNGIAKEMLSFIVAEAKKLGLCAIELNVNKENFETIKIYEHMGFERIRAEKNDIGSGYFMDDYVYRLDF